VTAYRFFNTEKKFKLQHQFSNIVKKQHS